MANFAAIFGVAVVLCAAVTFLSSDFYKKKIGKQVGSKDPAVTEEVIKVHNDLLRRYLFVYLLATLSDWLQGPFVYALYMDYGFQQHEIAQLFVAGFGSSMIFGSFVGGMADWGGRRLFVIIYAVVYAASCITKHFNNYGILMIGRLLGGVSTSLLFSVFDAWLIRSHSDADLPKSLLSKSFSWAAFGNSIIAILAGLIGNKIAETPMTKVTETIYMGRLLNPFDFAILCLVVCAVGASFLWAENYGETEKQLEARVEEGKGDEKWYGGLRNALVTTMRNRDIMLCGIISSLFEGSMYIFVFMWTPLLKAFIENPAEEVLPFGVIFSTFMVFCMTGSSLFSILVGQYPVEKLAVGVVAVGAIAMGIVSLSISETVSFLGMNLFEICVGMYFPIMGTMKGIIVPESKRAAIYNLFRIPLNFIVVLSLLADPSPAVSFTLNFVMLAAATFLQGILTIRRAERNEASDRSNFVEDDNVPLIQESGLEHEPSEDV